MEINNNYITLNNLFNNINRKHKLFKLGNLEDIAYTYINYNNHNQKTKSSRIYSKSKGLEINECDLLLKSNTSNENNNLNIVEKKESNDIPYNDIEEIKDNKRKSKIPIKTSINLEANNSKYLRDNSFNIKICNSNSSVKLRGSNWINSSTMKERKEIVYTMNIPEPMPKYIVKSNNNSEIKFDNNELYLDDNDIKNFFEYIIEDNKGSTWEHIIKDPNINCFRRPVPNSPCFLIKCSSIIEGYSSQEIYHAIYDVNCRKSWDSVFSNFVILREETKINPEIIYMSIKTPPLVTNRDFVQQRKTIKNFPFKSTHIIHFKSVEDPLCPPKSNFIRAHTYVSGYFIQQLSDNPLKTRLILLSHNDVKGSIPKYLVNKVAAKAPKDWVKSLIKGCELTRKKQKN